MKKTNEKNSKQEKNCSGSSKNCGMKNCGEKNTKNCK